MSAQAVENRFKSQSSQIGRVALNALYPQDVEAYLLAIALMDSRGNTVDYFSWPILPDEIRETSNELTTIKKTMGSVNVLKNSSFVPVQIFIKGDFGRKFKLLVGGQNVEFAGFGISIQDDKFKVTPPNILEQPTLQFSNVVKTGYGCVKMLEAIKDKSKKLDRDNKPFSLYLYNPILGNNYQVEFNSFTHMQDKGHYNMYPGYNLQLTGIAPLSSILSRGANIRSALKNLTVSAIQKRASGLASKLMQVPNLGT